MDARDEALARRAAEGDSTAFAELYERYERSAYNLAYRLTGSRDDAADATQETFLKVLERLPRLDGRELNFGAYVMTAARNASYDVIERRKRATPSDEVPEPAAPDHEAPENEALRDAHQEQIRAANETLPPRQREVLALRELQDLSYGEVAQIMGMNQNSVAQLISRARINLRDGLRQTALGSVASASPQCDRALPLLAMYQDGVLEDPWLAEHLVGCGPCRVRLEAMEEAAVAYRQWLLLVPALWLREETAEAHERVSARTNPRARKLLAAAAAVFALLAFVAVEGAETPTRAYAPPAATPAAEPIVHAVATKPQAKRQAPKPRRRAKVVASKPRVAAAPESPPANAAPRFVAATEASPAAAPDPPASKPAPSKPPRVRPRRDPRPVQEPVVLTTPAPVDQPAATTGDPPPPPPPCTGPDCPGTPQPCPGTSAAGCPPPPGPTLTCRTCRLVAPTPTPTPTPRALVITTRP